MLIDSPSNPAGVVLSASECRDLLDLCRSRGVLLISDEIYTEFTFEDHLEDGLCPSPARFDRAHEDVLVIRGFGKTWGCTGWRMGYAAGPARVIAEMTKLQQYSFVCSPTPLQHGCVAAFDVDMRPTVARFAARRDRAMARLAGVTDVPTPGGAFYLFVPIPERAGMTGKRLFERAVERNLLLIPGGVFSNRDTHVRVSIAAPDHRLDAGIGILAELLGS